MPLSSEGTSALALLGLGALIAQYVVRRAQSLGVPVGLGTDVAGGYSPSMLVSCRHAVCGADEAAPLAPSR